MSSLVSINNSTTLNLSAGQSFQGSYETILEYSQISVLTILGSNQTATLTVYFSPDGTDNNSISKSTFVGPNHSYEHIFEIVSKYYKVVVTANQGTAVTGSLHAIHHLQKTKPVSVFLNETITNSHSCEINRSLLTGATVGNQYKNVAIDANGLGANSLMVSILKPLTAFGELKVVNPTTLIQVTGTYNQLNSQLFQTYKYEPAGSPLTDVLAENTTLTARASSNERAYAILKTRRQCIYHAGQGLGVRFAGFFPSGGGSNTMQLVGFGNRGNGLYFGYSNTDFGILMRTRGRAPIYRAVVQTAATSAGNVTITLGGTAYTVPVTNAGGNTSFTAYELAKYTYSSNQHVMWNSQAVGNNVYYTYYNSASNVGTTGFAAGTTGMTLSNSAIITDSIGTNFQEYFYPRTEWNIDPMNGTGPSSANLDFRKGNVYEIQMQWLGYGRIAFAMEDHIGRMQAVHHISYANSNQLPSLELPHGAITLIAETTGPNATIVPTVKFSSLAAQVEGQIIKQPPLYSAMNTRILSGTTEYNILALCIRNNYRNFSTVGELYPSAISFNVDAGNNAVNFRVYLNPTLSPTPTTSDFPNFQYVNDQSIALYDATSLTYSGGTLIYQCTVSKDSSFQLTGGILESLYVGKDDTILITAKGNNNTGTVSVVWYEEK